MSRIGKKPIAIPKPPPFTAALVAKGKEAWNKMQCAACHGAHDQAFMSDYLAAFVADCLACHDGVDKMKGFDHSQTKFPLAGRHVQLACAGCHTSTMAVADTPSECAGCHNEPSAHARMFGVDCAACHAPVAWTPAKMNNVVFDHARTGFALTSHVKDYDGSAFPCIKCHPGTVRLAVAGASTFDQQVCMACHARAGRGRRPWRGTTCLPALLYRVIALQGCTLGPRSGSDQWVYAAARRAVRHGDKIRRQVRVFHFGLGREIGRPCLPPPCLLQVTFSLPAFDQRRRQAVEKPEQVGYGDIQGEDHGDEQPGCQDDGCACLPEAWYQQPFEKRSNVSAPMTLLRQLPTAPFYEVQQRQDSGI